MIHRLFLCLDKVLQLPCPFIFTYLPTSEDYSDLLDVDQSRCVKRKKEQYMNISAYADMTQIVCMCVCALPLLNGAHGIYVLLLYISIAQMKPNMGTLTYSKTHQELNLLLMCPERKVRGPFIHVACMIYS
jgi:hypothetical protein